MTNTLRFSRRDALAMATLVVGGAVSGIAPTALVAQWRDGGDSVTGGWLGDEDLRLLEAVADTIVPATDTPGAAEAGAPGFIDFLLAQWASDPTRQAFVAGMDMIRSRARQTHAQGFEALDSAQREALLTALDREFLGRPREGFGLVKNLVVFAYFTSELGATRALRFDPMPGAYGCRPFDDGDRDWATNGWRIEL